MALSYKVIFENNKKWVEEKLGEDIQRTEPRIPIHRLLRQPSNHGRTHGTKAW